MLREMVYFDYNSTTPLHAKVKEVMLEVMSSPLNPSALHHFGRQGKQLLETARRRIIDFSGGNNNYNAVFTSSGTESNNLALKGLKNIKIITTTIEHISIHGIVRQGIIPVDSDGVIDLVALEQVCAEQKSDFIVSIIAANNETGVVQPLKEAARIVHQYDGIIHSDAAQAFGKIPLVIEDLDLDMVSLSGHKFGGPLGAAALIFRKNLDLQPMMIGGGQEFRFRSGTQNLAAIHGFGIAAELAVGSLNEYSQLSVLRDYIAQQLIIISPQSVVFSRDAIRLPNTLSISMPSVSSETQVIHFDINGFAVSAGSACSSGRIDLPRVQMNMGYSEDVARTSLRISLGRDNNIAEAKAFIRCWQELFNNSNAYKHAA